MPRQRLAPGEHGKITDTRRGEVFYATTYLRLHSGKLREREASSRKSAEDARRELKRRIKAELEAGEPTGAVNHKTTLDELFETWILAKINDDRISERTVTLYRDAWRLHGKQIGELRIRELSTSRADAHVKTLPPSASVMLRSVLAGMFSMAVRYDVLAHNPIRETRATSTDRKPARAITPLEFEQVRLAVAARPLEAAFVELLAATGARPAEVLAIRWEDVDLLGTPPTVTVSGTVVDAGRIAGKPTHRQEHRKGQAPPHTVALPSFGVKVLTGLYSVTGPGGRFWAGRAATCRWPASADRCAHCWPSTRVWSGSRRTHSAGRWPPLCGTGSASRRLSGSCRTRDCRPPRATMRSVRPPGRTLGVCWNNGPVAAAGMNLRGKCGIDPMWT